MGLHLGTKTKSNGCLDIGTEGVVNYTDFTNEINSTNYFLKELHTTLKRLLK